jgi:hypothetical protein
MVTFDEGEADRAVSWAGLVAFAILLVPAGRLVVLGRRKTPRIRWPPCSCRHVHRAVPGIDRYRVPEVALVVLAAVGIDAFLDRRRGGADHTLASTSRGEWYQSTVRRRPASRASTPELELLTRDTSS